jgi:hypothetical protein
MTQDEIEHMWKVASNDPNHDTNWHDPVVIAFAKLIAAKEREECAELRNMFHPIDGHGRKEMIDAMNRGLDEYQAAIRARGQA